MVRRKRQWRGDEIEQLWNRYPAEGPVRLAADLGRTPGSVDAMAARFQLRSLTRRDRQSSTRRDRNQGRACGGDATAVAGGAG